MTEEKEKPLIADIKQQQKDSFENELTILRKNYLRESKMLASTIDDLRSQNQELLAWNLQISKLFIVSQGCALSITSKSSSQKRLPKNAAKCLGVTRNASLQEVKTAYKNRILKVHPDKNQSQQTIGPAEFLTKLLNNAYEACNRHFSKKTEPIIIFSDEEEEEENQMNDEAKAAAEEEFSP